MFSAASMEWSEISRLATVSRLPSSPVSLAGRNRAGSCRAGRRGVAWAACLFLGTQGNQAWMADDTDGAGCRNGWMVAVHSAHQGGLVLFFALSTLG